MMRSGTDDIHKLTEAVYKNLVENFNSGVRHILLTGKAYYKSLQAVNVTAQAYNEALARVGSAAKICRGGTEEIGEAILQIAEAQKEIQARLEDSTKALFTELILPLEQKLEKDFKRAHSDAKKYVSEHKVVMQPFNKACESLKKFRKKTKNKLVYDNEKEAQHMRSLENCRQKLDKFRIQGLKLALMEERRCHCFVLQRLCAISHLKAAAYRAGLDMYSSLPEWRQISSNPHVLPPSADLLIADYLDEPFEPMNGGPGYHSNGFLHRDPQETQSLSLSNEFRRSKSTQDLYRQSGHFDGTKTLPPRSVAPQPPKAQIQAMYSFTGAVDNQLSFAEGDLITVMGEHSDGWQYGQNNATQKLGWFPLSFTQPVVNSGRVSPSFKFLSSNQRFKSMGDLHDSRSLSEYTQHYEHDVPGNVRRPKSLYEGPARGALTPQAVRPHVPEYNTYNSVPPHAPYPTPSLSQADCDNIYQPIFTPPDSSQQLQSMYMGKDVSPQHTSSIYTSHGRPMQNPQESAAPIYSSQVSPPLPPPPSPPLPNSHINTNQPQVHPRANTLPATTTGLRGITGTHQTGPAPAQSTALRSLLGVAAPPPAPAVPPPPPPPPAVNIPPPPPLPNPGTPHKQPTYVSSPSISLYSQQNSQVTGNPGNAHLSSAGSHMSSGNQSSSARQQTSLPPPPPPPHDGEIEDNVNYQSNPMFASVSLRQTRTNDRSAPKF